METTDIPVGGTGPWAMAMRWHDLLFAHWPVSPVSLRGVVPSALEIDTFEGEAWLAIVPFRMTGVRPRFVPALPGLSSFPEINLRTYVRHGGRRGVYFFSLDASDWFAVRVARACFRLPYFDARMSCESTDGGWIRYRSERVHRGAPRARFEGRYRPVGPVLRSPVGSLEHFLTERYALFTADRRGRVRRGDIEHAPWPLQVAECEIDTCEMTRLIGMSLPDRPPLLHFAKELSVKAWLPRRSSA